MEIRQTNLRRAAGCGEAPPHMAPSRVRPRRARETSPRATRTTARGCAVMAAVLLAAACSGGPPPPNPPKLGPRALIQTGESIAIRADYGDDPRPLAWAWCRDRDLSAFLDGTRDVSSGYYTVSYFSCY